MSGLVVWMACSSPSSVFAAEALPHSPVPGPAHGRRLNPPHGKFGRAPSDWGRVRSLPDPGLVHPKRLQPGGGVLDSPWS